ncbi:MAG TPA: hypothetical protein ENN47_06360 [Mesotoga infera]|uniref:Uncharacterized protein n=1 Tax=Mesotoga infera TaxID=1236046 RepID=A0A7C1CTY2_9BACT|nr:hypothetical protein [Mesotoga infera]
MPKSILSVIVFLAIAVLSFSFSQKLIVEDFKIYVDDYSQQEPQLPKVVKLIEDLDYLSIYRLYKLQMVGSIEKKESSTTIAGLLTKHLEAFTEEDFRDSDDRIAYSAFLAWVLSDISGKAFETYSLNEMPAYLEVFNSYSSRVRSMAEVVYKEWIAYSLGLLEEKPGAFPDALETSNSFSSFSLKVDAPVESEQEILSLSDNRIIDALNETVAKLSSKEYSVSALVEEEISRLAIQTAMDLAQLGDAEMMSAGRELFRLWLLRSMGLIEYAPFFPESIAVREKEVAGFQLDIEPVDSKYQVLIDSLEENPGVRTTVIEKIEMGAQLLSMKQFTPVGLIESDIADEVRKIVPIQANIMGGIRNELSANLVLSVEKRLDLWWLRVIVYALLVVLAFTILPFVKKYLIGLIILLETTYVFFIGNIIAGIFDLSLHSIFVLPAFAFLLMLTISSLLNKRKRSRILILKLILLVLISIFPFLNILNEQPEIAMDNFEGFYDSVYYSTLKNDVFLAPESMISLQTRDLNSLVSSELNALKRILRVVIPNKMNSFSTAAEMSYSVDSNGRLRVAAPAFNEYFSIENQTTYISELQGLTKDIDSFIRDSNRNSRSYSSSVSALIATSERIVVYAGEKMREDFTYSLETALGSKPELATALNDYHKEIDPLLESDPSPVPVKVYRVREFAALIVALLLLAVTLFVVRKPIISYMNLAIIVVYFFLVLPGISSLNLFVQGGSPILRVTINPSINVLFLIVFAGIIVLSVLWILLSHKKGSVSE